MNIRLSTLSVLLCCFLLSTSSAQNKNLTTFVSEEQTVNGFSNFFLGVDYSEPYIVTNPRDQLNIICAFINGFYYTLDGLNWRSIEPPNSGDPFLAFDSLGNAYNTPSPPWTYTIMSVRKSTDKRITWSGSNLITNMTADKPSICANQSGGIYSNYLYSGWQSNGANDGTHFSRSIDQGATWSPELNLNPGSNFFPYLAVGPAPLVSGGILYYGTNKGTYGPIDTIYQVTIKKSSDAGITFSNEIIVSDVQIPLNLKGGGIKTNPCIQMAADNSYGLYRGNVYIVYTGKGSGTDKADIFFTKSTNYGNNWSAPMRLNDDNTLNDQWMPAISVGNNGKIYIVWYDSRNDPQNNLTLLYGTVSSNGGTSFSPDFPVSTIEYNPLEGTLYGFMGEYLGVSATGNSAIAAWYDSRNHNYGSYVGYLPDFAMTVTPQLFLGSNDSATAMVKVPAIKGPYTGNVKFSCSLDSIPSQGNISYNYLTKDSIAVIPDSLLLKIKLTNVTSAGKYRLRITGRNMASGVPVHSRIIYLMINTSMLNIGTNRNGRAGFRVNDTLYNTQQRLVIPNGTNVTVQAMSPVTVSSNTRYIFTSWSDYGDTAHNFVINSEKYLTAYYKTQFKLFINSSVGNTFGGNIFYDSSQTFTFGVNSKRFTYNGLLYSFAGWSGVGANSYTSQDSTGNDTTITLPMYNSIVEVARWVHTTGISQISAEIPGDYKLYNAYPNPFNPSVNIKFALPQNAHVILKIYDILGKEVAILLNEKMNAGLYTFQWNANGLPSGIYFYRIGTDKFTDTKRILLIK
ncbi:MAG: T9SS type A sorting domain-containing protein [Ignavibacteria bacterium]|nr:T9SS type A sorting domain-containing protein [Ignavibacteria bacterium]